MAEDDQDRTREADAEREAEIDSEMERVGEDPDQVNDGTDSLGTQSAESGTSRERTDAEPELRRTTDPNELRDALADRDGYPARAPGSDGDGGGERLRIGFRDRDEDLEEIPWDEFQEAFQEAVREEDLFAVYSEEGSGVDGGRPVALRTHGTDD